MRFYATVVIILSLASLGMCQAPKKKSQPQLKSDTVYTTGKRSSDGIGKYYLGREISFVMVDVYHELEYPYEMLQAIKRCLKKDGAILLLEYRAEDSSIAIKTHHKMTTTQANKEMLANGFKLKYDGEFLPIQHFLLYKKNE